jgi:acyl carrier protein
MLARSLRTAQRVQGVQGVRSFCAPGGSYLSVAEVTSRVLRVVRQVPQCPTQISETSSFAADLGFDSMIRKALSDALAAEFCLNASAAEKDAFLSPANVIAFVAASPKAR